MSAAVMPPPLSSLLPQHTARFFPLLKIEIEREADRGRDKNCENKEDKDALPDSNSALAWSIADKPDTPTLNFHLGRPRTMQRVNIKGFWKGPQTSLDARQIAGHPRPRRFRRESHIARRRH